MKVLILLVFCLSVIGCGRRGERIHNIKDLDQDQLNVVNNKFDIDIIALNLNTKSRRNIKPNCRGIEGCLKVCEYFDKAKCKQLSIDKVLAFWMNQISMYSKWEQARNDLNLIATEPSVSDFLSNIDKDNQVVEALFNLSIAANCPINEQPNILFSYTPHVSLYLGAPESSTEGGEEGVDADADRTDVEAAEAKVAAAQEELREAEAEAVKAQEALTEAEAAKEALAADASEGEVEAAEANVTAAKEALAAAEAKVAASKEAVEAAGAKLVAAQEAAEAGGDVECAPGVEFSPAGSVDAEAAALAAQERADKCPGLARVELSGDGGAADSGAAGAEADEAGQQAANAGAAAPPAVTAADTGADEANQPAADADAGADADREVAAADEDSKKEDMPQQQMPVSTKKKIMDGQVLYFNLPVFAGYIKKCFGFDSKTFSEMALEIENKKAFELGDKVISKACSENSECIRLSYCAINSELVWKNLKPSVTEAGCDYEGFSEMLP